MNFSFDIHSSAISAESFCFVVHSKLTLTIMTFFFSTIIFEARYLAICFLFSFSKLRQPTGQRLSKLNDYYLHVWFIFILQVSDCLMTESDYVIYADRDCGYFPIPQSTDTAWIVNAVLIWLLIIWLLFFIYCSLAIAQTLHTIEFSAVPAHIDICISIRRLCQLAIAHQLLILWLLTHFWQ